MLSPSLYSPTPLFQKAKDAVRETERECLGNCSKVEKKKKKQHKQLQHICLERPICFSERTIVQNLSRNLTSFFKRFVRKKLFCRELTRCSSFF
ncbi:hypothetical protein I3760_14G080200 [Carya illinoinensis]|nr:hypothetical protein I3760_14G080200 [Carya illinoinensis]